MKTRAWLVAGAVLAGAAVVAVLSWAGPPRGAVQRQSAGPEPRGEPVPEALFETLDGGVAALSDHLGDPIVLNFWGTWCLPCRREIPELVALHDAYEDRGLRVIGVAVRSGPAERIEAYAEELGVDYTLWIGSSRVATERFGVFGYPTTLIIDGTGRIRREFVGPQSYETLVAALDPIIAKSP